MAAFTLESGNPRIGERCPVCGQRVDAGDAVTAQAGLLVHDRCGMYAPMKIRRRDREPV